METCELHMENRGIIAATGSARVMDSRVVAGCALGALGRALFRREAASTPCHQRRETGVLSNRLVEMEASPDRRLTHRI